MSSRTAVLPWDRDDRAVNVGVAEDRGPVQPALRRRHARGGGFDLPPTRPVFEHNVASFGLANRRGFDPGGCFVDPLSAAGRVGGGPHPA